LIARVAAFVGIATGNTTIDPVIRGGFPCTTATNSSITTLLAIKCRVGPY
jgi:hypothetical protein